MKERELIGALIGLVGASGSEGKTENTDEVLLKALAYPALSPQAGERELGEETEKVRREKDRVAPNCAHCPTPCGNTSEYDLSRLEGEEPSVRQGKLALLTALEKAAAAVCRRGVDPAEDYTPFYRGLFYLSYEVGPAELAEAGEALAPWLTEKIEQGDALMLRRIIRIDGEKCNGCGLCAQACHEGAIQMVEGKARLVREDYCDGLGDCLPQCPTGAITFEEREAPPYDAAAVAAAKGAAAGCPGSRPAELSSAGEETAQRLGVPVSRLAQWPCQLKLAPVKAAWFEGAELLVAADCSAYAYGNLHEEFMKGRVTVIGCPKLDGVDYSEKLTAILRENDIRSVTLVRMEVPCCGGLEQAVRKALDRCGKVIPCRVETISIHGRVL